VADNPDDQFEALRDLNPGAGGDTPPSADPPQTPPENPAQDAAVDIDALMAAGGGDAAASEGDVPGAGEPPPDAPGDPPARPFDEGVPLRDPATGNAPSPDARPFEARELGATMTAPVDPKRVTMLNDVNLRVKIQLGGTRMLVEDVLKLGEGSVVELDKLAGDPVDVLVNERLIARGEVLVLNDNFCVRITEVLSHDPHRVSE
jgi:flagellar motor switch protein FliN/FliY